MVAMLVAVSLVATTATPAAAATFTVDSPGDVGDANPGDRVCSTGGFRQSCTLRAALEEANANRGDDVINLPAGTIKLSSGTPLPVANGRVEIVGFRGSSSGLDTQTTISGENSTRHFIVDQNGDLTLRGVTLTKGFAKRPQLSRSPSRGLGGLGSRAGENGGAIWVGSTGSVHLDRTAVRQNKAQGRGGALFISSGGEAHLGGTAISGNRSYGGVGGIDNRGTLTIVDGYVSGNVVSRGAGTGGIDNVGTATLINVTMRSNEVNEGGLGVSVAAIMNRGRLDINSSTIAHNELKSIPGSLTAGIGTVPGAPEQTKITNSILAHNTTYGASPWPDCAVDLTEDSHHNLMLESTGCGLPTDTSTWIIGQDAKLDNSVRIEGVWWLKPESPAIDAGYVPGSTLGRPCPATDQLGVTRIVCDIGAVDVNS